MLSMPALNMSKKSPRNANNRAEPPKVRATGNPRTRRPIVHKNIIKLRNSGVIKLFLFYRLLDEDWVLHVQAASTDCVKALKETEAQIKLKKLQSQF